MDIKDRNNVNMSLIVQGLRIKALESCLTDDQRKVFETSLLESKASIRKQLEEYPSLKPQQRAELLKQLDIL
ncbi:hypothetical protein SGQ44_18275 [Flavobacterium sp. Fl-77]|uniref:Uncharacterized protein n=1 Tax=Flavobacterium flavipigmentatum TaxID=2893884 RepID=A0AAJ2SGV6_9FLAO|nr:MULTISPECIES: hypothetical protein [unclassified Flavobacterium]MDX6181931.1 hypothetical protein [Flavobacterium sp. Fl-33]MDX6187702.1 hypothetical protein [Flavobacterium sp. Fl-77]UFH37146.1 hypothetical protein LNP22_10405 [Flavobacterium sp. F-70]